MKKFFFFEDENKDGKADKPNLYFKGFNQIGDGPAAGILALDDNHIYTTIVPHLWLLQDKNSDGKADKKVSIQKGFGNKLGWLGHDLHGLMEGNDGRIYWSMADRSFNFTNKAGRIIQADTGGVFRMWPDGSGLELYAIGLRNPQGLDVDSYGNIFTGDNNSDAGDKARLVYIYEGGDSGWRFTFQAVNDRAAWNQEKMWNIYNPLDENAINPPSWCNTPVYYPNSGPSGITYYPGMGWSKRYNNHFILCNFKTSKSTIDAFEFKPHGADFKVKDFHSLALKNRGVADIKFGFNGYAYVTSWGQSWEATDKNSAIIAISDSNYVNSDKIKKLETLAKKSFKKISIKNLESYLNHDDIRIRRMSQKELVRRNELKFVFDLIANNKKPERVRLHALWGLGMMAKNNTNILSNIDKYLIDDNFHVRSQSAQLIGDYRLKEKLKELLKLVEQEDHPRVLHFASVALGKLDYDAHLGINIILKKIQANKNRDRILRFAYSFALSGMKNIKNIQQLVNHPSKEVRLCAVNAIRQLACETYTGLGNRQQKKIQDFKVLEEFLNDNNKLVLTEVIRTIYDYRLTNFFPIAVSQISKIDNSLLNEPILLRLLEMSKQIPSEASVKAILNFLAKENIPNNYKALAFSYLTDWNNKNIVREKVLGYPIYWKNFKKRLPLSKLLPSGNVLRNAIIPLLQSSDNNELKLEAIGYLFQNKVSIPIDILKNIFFSDITSEKLRSKLIELAVIDNQIDFVKKILYNKKLSTYIRLQSIKELIGKIDNKLSQYIIKLYKNLNDNQKELFWNSFYTKTLEKSKQNMNSFLTTFILKELKIILNMNDIKPYALDLLLYANNYGNQSRNESMISLINESGIHQEVGQGLSQKQVYKKFSWTLNGGNSIIGKELFHGHASAQCLRCHSIQKQSGHGGNAGPSLSQIALKKSPYYIWESIVEPSAKLSDGNYGQITLILNDGKEISGSLTKETSKSYQININEKEETYFKANTKQVNYFSSMPSMKHLLKPKEIQNILAYVRTFYPSKYNDNIHPFFETQAIYYKELQKVENGTIVIQPQEIENWENYSVLKRDKILFFKNDVPSSKIFSQAFCGYIYVPQNGIYLFKMKNNNKSVFFLGGIKFFNQFNKNKPWRALNSTIEMKLKKGYYPYRLEYVQRYNKANPSLQLNITSMNENSIDRVKFVRPNNYKIFYGK